MMRLHLDKGLWAIALLATLGFSNTASAQPVECFATLDFSDNQYTACFTDVRRGADINDNNAPDLGGTGHTALNFTGGAGPAGDTWLTKFTPNGGTQICQGAAVGGVSIGRRCPHPHVQQHEGRGARGAARLRPWGQGAGPDPV